MEKFKKKLTNKLTPSLYHDKIIEYDNDYLVKILEKFIMSEPNKLKSKIIYFENIGDDKDLKFIKNYAYEILSSLGFYVDISKGMIEFWSYNVNGKKVNTPLDFHEDDYAVLGKQVDTVIFYTRKDNTLEGGDLEISENIKEYILFGLINLYTTKKNKIIKITSNDILAFNGNLLHKPQDISGNGRRDCIVVQFESKREILKFF
jgi:hypothetical protein